MQGTAVNPQVVIQKLSNQLTALLIENAMLMTRIEELEKPLNKKEEQGKEKAK